MVRASGRVSCPTPSLRSDALPHGRMAGLGPFGRRTDGRMPAISPKATPPTWEGGDGTVQVGWTATADRSGGGRLDYRATTASCPWTRHSSRPARSRPPLSTPSAHTAERLEPPRNGVPASSWSPSPVERRAARSPTTSTTVTGQPRPTSARRSRTTSPTGTCRPSSRSSGRPSPSNRTASR
jgi:hypothetical protein